MISGFYKTAAVFLLTLALSGVSTSAVCAQSLSQSNPGWVAGLNHYVYYLEMPVGQGKVASGQIESVIGEKAGVLSCAAKGNAVSYFVVHTSAPITKATAESWAISAGTTLTNMIAHGTRAYQAWQTLPGDTRIQRKGSH